MTDLGGGTGRDVLCLVGRELSLFLAINVSKIPDKQRRGFVELTVRRAAPYDDADFDVSWLGDWAAVWHWSRKRIVEGYGGELPARTRFASEGPYVGQVQESEGTRIEVLRLIAGFEGRIWRSGVLTASRWWPAEPTAEQWQLFLRGTGGAQLESTAPPPPVAAAINTRRWSRTTSRSQALQMSSLQAHVPRATLAVALAAVALFAWELGAIARAKIDVARANGQARNLDDSLKRILAARASADADLQAISALLALRQARPQHQLLAEVVRLMGGKQWRLHNWQQPTPDRIEATLALTRPDPEALVSAWEASPMFQDVTTELSRQQNEIVVRAKVSGAPAGAGQ